MFSKLGKGAKEGTGVGSVGTGSIGGDLMQLSGKNRLILDQLSGSKSMDEEGVAGDSIKPVNSVLLVSYQ